MCPTGLAGFYAFFAPMNVTGPALLTANDVALAYGHQHLLEAVTLLVAPGEKVGLLGRNGCGKTSLLRILAGHQRADAGEVARRRGLRVGYLPQEFELHASLTVRQNIEAGAADLMEWLSRYESGHGTDAELAVLLNQIDSADGWKLQARIKATASALSAAVRPGGFGAQLKSRASRLFQTRRGNGAVTRRLGEGMEEEPPMDAAAKGGFPVEAGPPGQCRKPNAGYASGSGNLAGWCFTRRWRLCPRCWETSRVA
jgi:energy-coupling factor transporter ATP-binding protein EcfA2